MYYFPIARSSPAPSVEIGSQASEFDRVCGTLQHPNTSTFEVRRGVRFVPKPFLLSRSSGLFVRFNVPLDLQAVIGRECLVRSLRGLRGDHARLVAASLGYALAQAFDRLRINGADMDTKKIVDAALAAVDRGEHRPYEVNIPGVGTIRADSPEDHARALEALAAMRVAIPGLTTGQAPGTFALAVPPSGPMLRASADKFLEHCRSLKKSSATLLETDHSVLQPQWRESVVGCGAAYGIEQCGPRDPDFRAGRDRNVCAAGSAGDRRPDVASMHSGVAKDWLRQV